MSAKFVNVSYKGNPILIFFETEISSDDLINIIKKETGIQSECYFQNRVGAIIKKNILYTYVEKFCDHPDFIISVEDLDIETPSEASDTTSCSSVDILEPDDDEQKPISLNLSEYKLDTSLNNPKRIVNSQMDLEEFIKSVCMVEYNTFLQKGTLENFSKITLSKKIIHNILDLDRDIRLNKDDFEKLASNLCVIFQHKVSASDFYSRFCNGKAANGKLLDQYNAYLKKLRILNLTSRKRPAAPSKSVSAEILNLDVVKDVTIKEDQDAFKDLTPGSLDLGEENQKWISTFGLRADLLATDISTFEYINKFPGLCQANGFKLLFIDVELQYKKKLNLQIGWDFYYNLLNKCRSSKNPRLKDLLYLVDIEKEENQKKALLIITLPYFLPNPLTTRKKSDSRRPTRIEVQESFICHYNTAAEADIQINSYVAACNSNKKPKQPRIILVGSPVELAIVTVATKKYTSTDIGTAIQICMSSYLALNIRYPPEVQRVWLFVQKYLFGITTPYDIEYPALESLWIELSVTRIKIKEEPITIKNSFRMTNHISNYDDIYTENGLLQIKNEEIDL